MQFFSFCPLFTAAFPSFYVVSEVAEVIRGPGREPPGSEPPGAQRLGSKVGGVVTDGGKLYLEVEKWREVLCYNGCSWVCTGRYNASSV